MRNSRAVLLTAQIALAKNHLNQSMTMEQLLEAERLAAEWMRKSKKIAPASVDNPPNAFDCLMQRKDLALQ